MVVLQNISKYYYTDTSVTLALRKINLEFHRGEFVAITGESGSGKSTLLNVISGMDTFDEGELYYNGEPTFQYDFEEWENFRRNQIGFVFQNYNLIGHYSALENIISALLIMEMDEAEAKERAISYLERVGLKGYENQRASELSSGQKQRLSIARALAKNTGVIVADEPTGNLDSETGEQIVSLLKELSKDRLVLMVTHNYEQAEPYVTRKVRLHDGELVEDVKVNEQNVYEKALTGEPVTAETTEKSSKSRKELLKEKQKKERQIAFRFARLNTRTQIGRSLLFRFFFLMTALFSFIFIGQLYKNADDISTRDYDDSIFLQKNDSRLSVTREDGKALTEEDIEKMKSVRDVVMVDKYDYANDVNYYIEEGKDYEFEYAREADRYNLTNWETGTMSELRSDKTPVFKKKKKFMKSISCIDEKDLKAGRMPESRNEIVLYSEDEKKLNTTVSIYFTAKNIMGEDNYYHNEFTITGFLKKETKQVYFHGDLCYMLSAAADGDEITLEYFYVREAGEYLGSDRFFLAINDSDEIPESEKVYDDWYRTDRWQFYGWVSQNFLVPPLRYDFYSVPVEQAVPGSDQIRIKLSGTQKGLTEELEAFNGVNSVMNISSEHFNDLGGHFIEVRQDVFDLFYPRGSTQASVYIRNYTKTDRVIRRLEKLGYIAVSTYRISSSEYNSDKVMERLVFLAISAGILLVLVLIELLLLRALMKIKIKDFLILKSLGMQFGIIRRISLYEMTRYCMEGMIVTVVVMVGMYLAGIGFARSMMIYYGIVACATYILYNLLLEYATVGAFNRLLRGRMMA